MRAVRWAAWVAVAMIPLGCQPGAGWLAWVTALPETVKPVYKLPAGKKVLVFTDDVLNPVAYQPIKAELAQGVNERLTQKKLAASVVPYDAFLTWASKTENLERLSVAEVGRALGADLVLYVHVDRLQLKEDERSTLWRGELATTVRVVDVREGRLWPQDRPEGYPVPQVETPTVDDPSPQYGEEVARRLADEMSEAVVNLFCEHTVPGGTAPPPPGERP
jgi:hypothetical protein